MKFRKLYGIIVATITPLTGDGRINPEAVAKLNRFLIDKGVHGLFPCGSTGEGVLLSMEERKKVAELTVKDASGKVPVVIHTGSVNMKLFNH